MAGEFSANRSRSRITDSNSTETEPPDPKSPNFITEQVEFVGKGSIKASNNRNRRSRSRSGTRITPTVLSLSDEHFIEDLEDYVKEMATSSTMDATGEQDVWTQLQQKESDLLLAAELGKALLEKNEELKKEQERITEEYSKKLEVSDCHIIFAYSLHIGTFYDVNRSHRIIVHIIQRSLYVFNVRRFRFQVKI